MFGINQKSKLGQNKAMKDKRTLDSGKKFSKTDVGYWRDKLFHRSNDDWHCRIGFGPRQDRWPLRTANREQAAARARDIWRSLQTKGFEATERAGILHAIKLNCRSVVYPLAEIEAIMSGKMELTVAPVATTPPPRSAGGTFQRKATT